MDFLLSETVSNDIKMAPKVLTQTTGKMALR
jgi:hypothetical protein